MRAIGIVGWSGAGKTTRITRLIPELNRRGLSVSTIKHTHHGLDVDQPGKDTYEHRAAGAREVLVASAKKDRAHARIARCARANARRAPRLLGLIEGFKRNPIVKIEVFREANGKPQLYPQDEGVVALVSDGAPPSVLPHASIDDIGAVADLIERFAEPVEALLQRLEAV